MKAALDLIVEVAPKFGGTCAKTSETSALLDLPVKLVDGQVRAYSLLLVQHDMRLTVREEAPYHLPPFCPERHINPGGTFCLYFDQAADLRVLDEPSAHAWMETVYRYLMLQERVRLRRQWPNKDTWAHGEAAYHQLQAQTVAAKLGKAFAAALADDSMQLRARTSNRRQILEVWVGETHMYSVWVQEQRVMRLKQRCFCGKSGARFPRRLRRCGDHAEQATKLTFAFYNWKKAEEAYWQAMRDHQCCGTCDHCPLQAQVKEKAQIEPPW